MRFIRDLIAKTKQGTKPETPVDVAAEPSGTLDPVPSLSETLQASAAQDAASPVFSKARPVDDAPQSDMDNDVATMSADDPSLVDLLDKWNTKKEDEVAPTPEKSVNIWDLDEPADSRPSPQVVPTRTAVQAPGEVAVPAPVSGRKGRPSRTKTRLLGFESSTASDVVDLFDAKTTVAPVARAKYPVGWIIVIAGPGRGESFTLLSGMSQIGRGEDQAVQLDFGDTAISRTNHAAIAYDPEAHTFLLGHGGKSNIVRLNDKPVISTETLSDGDIIRLGETTLRFVALCNEKFNWADDAPDGEENDDVAIA